MVESSKFRREIESLPAIFDLVGAFVVREKLDDRVDFALNFVVEELFTNMVKYNTGNGNDIDISLSRKGPEVQMVLIDRDVDPFDPSQLDAVDTSLPIEARVPGRLGIHLVRSIVDEISYSYRNREMKVTITRSLES